MTGTWTPRRGAGGLIVALGGALQERPGTWVSVALDEADRELAAPHEGAAFDADTGQGQFTLRLVDVGAALRPLLQRGRQPAAVVHPPPAVGRALRADRARLAWTPSPTTRPSTPRSPPRSWPRPPTSMASPSRPRSTCRTTTCSPPRRRSARRCRTPGYSSTSTPPGCTRRTCAACPTRSSPPSLRGWRPATSSGCPHPSGRPACGTASSSSVRDGRTSTASGPPAGAPWSATSRWASTSRGWMPWRRPRQRSPRDGPCRPRSRGGHSWSAPTARTCPRTSSVVCTPSTACSSCIPGWPTASTSGCC